MRVFSILIFLICAFAVRQVNAEDRSDLILGFRFCTTSLAQLKGAFDKSVRIRAMDTDPNTLGPVIEVTGTNARFPKGVRTVYFTFNNKDRLADILWYQPYTEFLPMYEDLIRQGFKVITKTADINDPSNISYAVLQSDMFGVTIWQNESNQMRVVYDGTGRKGCPIR